MSDKPVSRGPGRPPAALSKPLAFEEQERKAIFDFLTYNALQTSIMIEAAQNGIDRGIDPKKYLNEREHWLKHLKSIEALMVRVNQKWRWRRRIHGELNTFYVPDGES